MDLREAAERDVLDVWRALASGRSDPSAGVEQQDGLLLTSSGVAFGYFNGAFVLPGGDAEQVVTCARDWFTERQRPYLLRARPEREDVAAAAAAAGLSEVDPLDLMALRVPEQLPTTPAPPRLEIVDTADRLGLHAAVLAAAFGAPPELMADYLGDLPLRDERFVCFIGYVDGQPVTVAAVYLHDGVGGIYNVATLGSHRGRGLGEAMTWHAIRVAAQAGARVVTLQPSAMGLPIYRRMGFERVGALRQWSSA